MPFYEEIAAEYDEMTGFDVRLRNASAFARRVIGNKVTDSALDVATGTGLYALALAHCGVRSVTGTDLSADMLKQAEAHAGKRGLGIRWIAGPMEELAERLAGERFDLLLCLGNSIPHLLHRKALHQTLSGFHSLLRAGGRVFVHVLNYDRLLEKRERIVEINRRGQVEFVRFYDFREDGLVNFNLLHIRWRDEECEHEIHSTVLYPYRRKELSGALSDCGFRNVTAYGGIDFGPFEPASSNTCLLAAERP